MLNFDQSKKKKLSIKKIIPGLGSRFLGACYRKQSIIFFGLMDMMESDSEEENMWRKNRERNAFGGWGILL